MRTIILDFGEFLLKFSSFFLAWSYPLGQLFYSVFVGLVPKLQHFNIALSLAELESELINFLNDNTDKDESFMEGADLTNKIQDQINMPYTGRGNISKFCTDCIYCSIHHTLGNILQPSPHFTSFLAIWT